MQAFAELYAALDETTRTSEKVAALKNYFASAAPADAIWAVSFLIGRRPKRLLESRKLAQWAIEEAGIPEWLFGECYQAVGDFAETIALLLPPAAGSTDLPLHYWVEERMLPLREADDDTRRGWLVSAWRAMDERQRFAWNKLLTGEFRVGVSQNLVVRALAEVSGVSTETIAHRLMGEWTPTAEFWAQAYRPRNGRLRRQPSLSVLPGLSARRPRRRSRRGRRVAGRVEVGRHSGTAHSPAVAHLPLVARRGADHRSLPGNRGDRRSCCPRAP